MARSYLEALYLEWRNNYLTVELFAEHNALTLWQAKQLIELAKSVAYSNHPEM